MSPLLFCLYIADIEKEFQNRNIGGTEINGTRVWSLAYADDIALLAENRVTLLDMLGTLRKYLRDKGLVLSVSKTKVIVFNRKRKKKKEKWLWGKDVIEEVEKFKYLGFYFNKEGNYKEHIKELRNKGIVAARKTWGLGEISCKEDFQRRMVLFNYLVKSVMGYGAEIWGWEARQELEKNKIGLHKMVIKVGCKHAKIYNL